MAPRKRVLNGVNSQPQMSWASVGAKKSTMPAPALTTPCAIIGASSGIEIDGFLSCGSMPQPSICRPQSSRGRVPGGPFQGAATTQLIANEVPTLLGRVHEDVDAGSRFIRVSRRFRSRTCDEAHIGDVAIELTGIGPAAGLSLERLGCAGADPAGSDKRIDTTIDEGEHVTARRRGHVGVGAKTDDLEPCLAHEAPQPACEPGIEDEEIHARVEAGL